MKALTILIVAVPVFGSYVTSDSCSYNDSNTTTFCVAGRAANVNVTPDSPFDVSINLRPDDTSVDPNLGTLPGRIIEVTVSYDFEDSFAITSVPSGTLQWFGDFDRTLPGSPQTQISASIGGSGWPSSLLDNSPVIIPFTAGEEIPLFIHFSATGACCHDGPESGSWFFLLSQIKVFDADGDLVNAPGYSSTSGYLYPVLGAVPVPEPAPWMLALFGLGLAKLRLRHRALER